MYIIEVRQGRNTFQYPADKVEFHADEIDNIPTGRQAIVFTDNRDGMLHYYAYEKEALEYLSEDHLVITMPSLIGNSMFPGPFEPFFF